MSEPQIEQGTETPRNLALRKCAGANPKNLISILLAKHEQIEIELNAAKSEVKEYKQHLSQISLNLCGIKIGEVLEGIDEPETDFWMVYSFVEGAIDKQAYRADKAELERDTLRDQLAEALKDKARFDWLEKEHCNTEWFNGKEFETLYSPVMSSMRSLRDAVDLKTKGVK